ncbi:MULTISPECIES: hypothetical protein [Bacillus]|uniref:hypothetical protein n=1 Tax=Bacillus TaxID=1386 RepID=UPI00273E87CA|nr:hypothetical protein [Bacillus sp. MMSF_3328]
MKKSYSTLDLLQKQLSGITEPKGFFSFFSDKRYLKIAIPHYYLIRAKVFIQDLRDNFNDQVPFNFDVAILIWLLYDDFLTQVKRGKANHEHVTNFLVSGKKRYFQKSSKQTTNMKPLTTRVFSFEHNEEELTEESLKEAKTAYITLRMRESEILRGEVLLDDLFNMVNTDISVEEMVSIIFMDFMQTVKTEGSSMKLQRTIISHISK